MLSDEINKAQRLVRTDAYQMSIGEIVSMYDSEEIIVDPEFQRLFRWNISQKSRLIESLLLGIPLPSIFVFEKEDGKWELIDGLQRMSTILEFMGQLKSPDGGKSPPSILEGTKYLPSLHSVVWEVSDQITDTPPTEQVALDKASQLAIRRARLGVEILKRPSDNQTKFDLFQRLNAGGTQANAQELRNCIMLMVNAGYFRQIRNAADQTAFTKVVGVSEEQRERQRHLELAVRFLVYTRIAYDGTLDVEAYIDEGIVTLAERGNSDKDEELIESTFQLLRSAMGDNALRRFEKNRHLGKVGLVGLEGIAVGVAKNLKKITALPDPKKFIQQRIKKFWTQPEIAAFTAAGIRGTTRIQKTLPFGEHWFHP
jgi:Protein of unknown function DUF262